MKILKTLFVTILLGVAGLVESHAQPTGAINGVFSVSECQYVYFAKGNLQYNAMQGTHATADGGTAQGTWRFADHQWDYVGSDNCNISQTYDGWIDLFGYGTSGWNSGATCYQPWSVDKQYYYYYLGGNLWYNAYNNMEGDYANADWGVYNAISNGGNQPGLWRTLSCDEWHYVLSLRNTRSGIRWAKATVNGVNGLILLPDTWDASYYSLNGTNESASGFDANVISAMTWTFILENQGAIFFPASGFRGGSTTTNNLYYYGNSYGFYHSTTSSGEGSRVFEFSSLPGHPNGSAYTQDRSEGNAVRLVRSAPAITHNISTSANPTNGGGIHGAGNYCEGSTCTLTATSSIGFSFLNWTVDGEVVSTDPTYSFMVWSDQTVVANFVRIGTITATADPEGADEITGAGVYQIGETCTLHAHSSECFTFLNWKKDGVVVSTELDYSFTVTEDADYVACFSPNSITIGVNASPSQCGTVSGGGTYYCNDPVTLTATPAEGYYFIGWNVSTNGDSWFSPGNNNNPYSFNVRRNETYTALFEPIPSGIYVGDVSANSREGLPAGNENSLTQQIYTASEIGMPGGGRLYGVSFFVSDFHYSYNVTYDCDIYLVHTNKSSYNDGNDWVPVTEADRIFSGQVAMQEAKWTTIAFDTPFEYDGTSNLALMVDNNAVIRDNVYFRVFDTPDYQAISISYYQESYDPFLPPSGGLLSKKNQIVFITNHHTISAVANPAEGGTVTGAGAFAAGGVHTLTATANEGYVFVNWTENGEVVSSDENYSFNVERDRSLVANFVTINISPGPYVDLGLPSGALWASCNLGAETPEGYGNFYAWGETQPKDNYDWTTYQYCNGSSNTLTKYCSYAYCGYNGFTDDLTVLLPEDDAATVNLGEGCHIPTETEWHELVTNTINVWTTINGVYGQVFVASNGNSIFIPAAGYYKNDEHVLYGSYGEYWSSCLTSIMSDYASMLKFYDGFFHDGWYEQRAYGLPVRPVHSALQSHVSATANPSSCGTITGAGTYDHGTICTLTASPNDGYAFVNWTENGEVVSWDDAYSFTVSGDRNLVANFIQALPYLVDDFDDGVIDTLLWPSPANGEESDGWMKIITNEGGGLSTNFIVVPESGTIVIEGVFKNTFTGLGSPYDGYYLYFNGDEQSYIRLENYDGGLSLKTQLNGMSSEVYLCDLAIKKTHKEVVQIDVLSGTLSYCVDNRLITTVEVPGLTDLPASYFKVMFYGGVRVYTMNYIKINANEPDCNIAASANPSSEGSVSGVGTYGYGEICTLTAAANSGYCFMYWTENGQQVSPDASYSFIVTEDRELVANFCAPLTIATSSNPVEGGMVSGAGVYDYGATCTVTAEANAGYTFMYWTENGNQVSSNATYSFTVTSNRNLEAKFALPFAITTSPNLTGSGTLSGMGMYDYGSTCTVTAVPNEGYLFQNWSLNGEVVSCNAIYNFTVTEDLELEAVFMLLEGIYIGEGEGTSTAFPNSMYRSKYSISQQIYTSEEIGMSGDITSICFFNAGGGWSRDLDIYIVHTDKTVFDSNTDWIAVSEADRVYSGNVSFNKGYWTTIVLDTPFSYNSLSNLAIMVDDNSGWYDYYCTAACRVFNSGNNQAIYQYDYSSGNNYNPFNASSYSGNLSSVKNQIVLNMANVSILINATANPAEWGMVNGIGTYNEGSACTLTATANSGYTFVNWTEDGEVVSWNANYSFIVNGHRSLVANFTSGSGVLNGAFSVSENTSVRFSKGNLQYQASTNNWRFAENQWDYVGTQNPSYGSAGGTVSGSDNVNISSTYDGWIDLFCWGTSGFNHGARCYQPWSTSTSCSDYYAYGNSAYNLFDQTGRADWGYNAIINGGNIANQWRTLTKDEWSYLLDSRNTPSGVRFAIAQLDGVNGVILLPDDWDTGIYELNNTNNSRADYSSNVLTAIQWEVLESSGAVFLPAAGSRSGNTVFHCGSISYYYWSATISNDEKAYCMWNLKQYRYCGFSVRLVQSVQPISMYEINAIPNPVEGGTVLGTGVFEEGATCLIVAMPAEGYTFVNWTENGEVVSTEATYSFTVEGNRNLVANFDEVNTGCNIVFDLYDSYGDGWNGNYLVVSYGDVTEQYTIVSGSHASYSLDIVTGSVVSLSWIKGSYIGECSFDIKFENGVLIYHGSNLSATFQEDIAIDCELATAPYLISATANPTEGGAVEGGGVYEGGSSCTLHAIPNPGYIFVYWTENGQQVSTDATYSFTVAGNRDLVAYFSAPLTITVSSNSMEGGVVAGAGVFNYGTTCTLTATANPGYTFIKWTKNGEAVSYFSSFSFLVTENADYVAVFEETAGIVIGEPEAGNQYLPSYSYYEYALSQQIYTQDEVGGSTTVTGLSFFNTGGQKTRNYDIYLVHTDKTAFSSNTDWITVTESDRVFSGDVTMMSGCWTTIEFDTPFAYNGASNLAVVIDDNSGNYTGSPHMACRVFNTQGNQAIRVYSEGTNYDPTNSSGYGGTLYSAKNQIVLQTSLTQTVQLSSGWNWFSTYLSGEPTELLQMLENSLGSNGIVIKSNAVSTDYYEDYGWYGDLDDEGLKSSQMYMIKTNAACTVELEGVPANPAEVGITIRHGWNWIGFPCAEAMSVAEALSGFQAEDGDILKSSGASTDYYEGFGWYGELETMEPGEGFMYYSNSQTTKTVYFQTGSKKDKKSIGNRNH